MWLGSGIAVAMSKPAAVTAPIRPLAWEPPYVMGAALKRKKKKKKNWEKISGTEAESAKG